MVSVITRLQAAGWRMRDRLRGEEGQTSSEYLVIAGVVVVIIIGILATFKTQLGAAMTTITGKITTAVSGQ